jgi:hypothetical protein
VSAKKDFCEQARLIKISGNSLDHLALPPIPQRSSWSIRIVVSNLEATRLPYNLDLCSHRRGVHHRPERQWHRDGPRTAADRRLGPGLPASAWIWRGRALRRRRIAADVRVYPERRRAVLLPYSE